MLGLQWGWLIGFSLVLGALIAVGLLILWAVNRKKVVTGDLGIVGEIGVAETELNPEGRVFIHGEWWKAMSESRIPPGVRVRVIGLDRFTLQVEAATPMVPRPASVLDVETGGKEQRRDAGS